MLLILLFTKSIFIIIYSYYLYMIQSLWKAQWRPIENKDTPKTPERVAELGRASRLTPSNSCASCTHAHQWTWLSNNKTKGELSPEQGLVTSGQGRQRSAIQAPWSSCLVSRSNACLLSLLLRTLGRKQGSDSIPITHSLIRSQE